MDYDIVGSIKIKDGLFLGDEFAAQDLEFVVTNKVTRIINCAGKQIPNHWNTVGVMYLTYGWFENDNQVVFDTRDEVLNTTYKFIDDAINVGDSVLIHSVRGHNRSVCIIAAYMMRKFRWTLYKTLEFLHSRRPDLEIRASFFNQLLNLENKLTKLGMGAKTYNWKEIGETKDKELENEEILLTNTFLNSKNQELAEYNNVDDKDVVQKIIWIDQVTDQTKRKQIQQIQQAGQTSFAKQKSNHNPLVLTYIPPYENCNFKKQRYKSPYGTKVKSIVKGSNKIVDFKPPSSEKNLDGMNGSKQPLNSINNNNTTTTGHNNNLAISKAQHNQRLQKKYASAKDVTSNKLSNNFMGGDENENDIDNNNSNVGSNFGNNKLRPKVNNQSNNQNNTEDQRLQQSLNSIANKQLYNAFQQNQIYDNDVPQNQIYGGQSLNPRNQNTKQSTVQKVYGQKVGGRKKPALNTGINKGQNNYLGKQKQNQQYNGVSNYGQNNGSRLYGNQSNNNTNLGSNNNIGYMFEDNNQGQQFKSPQYNYESSFKNTQKIYSAPLGVVGRQTQVNNFLGGSQNNSTQKQKNQNHFEMPSLQGQNKSSNNFFPEQEKKVKRPQRPNNRPSTAPSKQKDGNKQQQSVNGFSMRNNNKNHATNGNHQDLFIAGQQRQKSAQQQNKDNGDNINQYGKKMRASSPGNFYQQNQFGKSGGKWKY